MRSQVSLICWFVVLCNACGSSGERSDVAAWFDAAISSGGVVGSGGWRGTGGTLGTGGSTTAALGAGGVKGVDGSSDAAGNLTIPIEQAGDYASCSTNDDCHVLYDNCTCVAVSTQVVKLSDPGPLCGVQQCLMVNQRVTGAVCQAGTCTLVRDPPCTADADCRLVWARCEYAGAWRTCACDAVHISNQTTRQLVSPDGACFRNMPENGRAICQYAHCSVQGIYPG